MDAYIYQAALYCEGCGERIANMLRAAGKAPPLPHIETTYDSDEFPKGPYGDGGGESDAPQHCDECHCFLENPLTSDGVSYVYDMVLEHLHDARGQAETIAEWIEFYGLDIAGLMAHAPTRRVAEDSALRIDPRTGRTEVGA